MAEHSNLPAPYESPWRQLGQALRSVVASLGLDVRILWRRNRSGELPRPFWWPRDLAAAFWPLVLVGALVLVGGLGNVLTQRRQAPATGESAPAVEASSQQTMVPELPLPLPLPPPRSLPLPPPLTQSLPLELERQEQPNETQSPVDALPPDAAVAELPRPDPLLAQLSEGLEHELIVSAHADLAPASLTLRLSAAFGQLDPRRQRRLAEDWLARCQELGFEQLQLVDNQDQLLGYRARVGSGMILLNPDATS